MPKRSGVFIGIGGGSGSGKTTIARTLERKVPVLENAEGRTLTAKVIMLDDYYNENSHMPMEKRRKQNYDHPDAIELSLVREHLRLLREGSEVEKPLYSFMTHNRLPERELVKPVDVTILEGLYALYDAGIRDLLDYTIFVATDPRKSMLRRLERDLQERGRILATAIEQYTTTVIPMYDQFVEPTRFHADFQINWDGDMTKATRGLLSIIKDLFA